MRIKSKWIILLGSLALACGLGLLIFTQATVGKMQKQSEELLLQAQRMITDKTVGTAYEYSEAKMPAAQINGEDIIGIIEFNSPRVILPLGDGWKKGISYPKRFSGSVYDNSLVIGGYYSAGQFDCLKKTDIGGTVTVTDMTGAQFSYRITDIKRKKSADADFLKDSAYDITLFVRDTKSLEYIIVRGSDL